MLRFFETVRAAHPSAPAPRAPYAEWHAWSCAHPAEFWAAVWRFTGVIADAGRGVEAWESVVEGFERMAPPEPGLGPTWFRGARLNFAENLLRRRDGGVALFFRDER
jgi:acetoacetyl-CoA synthetase